MPAELRPAVADRLASLVREAGTHLATGFLATPYLLPALADAGHLDLAYELLLQNTPPSWLAMINRGATTVWEDIELVDPAYRSFRVQPRPGGGLTSAEAAHESPHGRIESSWQLDGDRLRLRVVVPAGTRATVVLPSGQEHTAGPGTHTYVDDVALRT